MLLSSKALKLNDHRESLHWVNMPNNNKKIRANLKMCPRRHQENGSRSYQLQCHSSVGEPKEEVEVVDELPEEKGKKFLARQLNKSDQVWQTNMY